MMNLLVLAKQVPDTSEVALDANHSLVRDGVAQRMNPADEAALECALSLKDTAGACVTVMTMGKPSAEGMLREAAARGADRLVLLCDKAFAGADTLATAKTLQAAVNQLGPYDLILCGRKAVDGETGQVGPALAALLDIPVITNVTSFQLQGGGAQCDQLIEQGVCRWHVPKLPLLVTLCEWSLPLRLPTILGLRKAARAQITCLGREGLGLAVTECGLRGSPTRVMHVHRRDTGLRACEMLSVSALMEKGALL